MIRLKHFAYFFFLTQCTCVIANPLPHNYMFAYERLLKTECWENSNIKLDVTLEDGSTRSSRNSAQDKVDFLAIYNPSESSLAMLLGALEGSSINAFANSLLTPLGPVTDDGVRGHFLIDSHFEQTEVTLSARIRIPAAVFSGFADIGIYFPIKHVSIAHIQLLDQTENITSADLFVKQALTNNIVTIAENLGQLDIGDWDQTGLGDISLMAKWYRDFLQDKPHIKKVRLSFYGGVSLPTSPGKDQNKAFSFALGNDNAWALPLGACIDIDFSKYIRIGLELNLLTLLDETSIRRLKTDTRQTEFFLLNKGLVTKSFGPMWRFTIYTQIQNIFKGFAAFWGYHFTKHDNDTLYPQTDQFIHSVVNSAATLQEWRHHAFSLNLVYDTATAYPSWWVKPHISLFYKMPLTGKRSFMTHTWGSQIGITF